MEGRKEGREGGMHRSLTFLSQKIGQEADQQGVLVWVPKTERGREGGREGGRDGKGKSVRD